MSYTSKDWRIAITNLLQKTSKGEVSWEVSELFAGDVWTDVDRSFQCTINDKIYVVSETRSKYYIDEDEFVWNGGYDFSVYKKSFDNEKLTSAPKELSILANLFDAAEKSYAFSSNVLGDLLD